jgi:hypothetical protein
VGKFTANLDQEFHARRTVRRPEITRLEKGRYNAVYVFAMSLCSCALASLVLAYVIAR